MSTVLKTKRAFPFQGKWLPEGVEIDMRDYPQVSKIPGKWDLMIDAGYFADMRNAVLDPARHERRARFEAAAFVAQRPDPVMPVDRFLDAEDHARLEKPTGLQCGDCGFQATSPSGLKTHTTRKHTKE